MNRETRWRACAVLTFIGFIRVSAALAESVPIRGTTDSRIRTALYRDDEVYTLKGFVGYGIELEFEPGEQFVGQAGGDLDAITFGSHENHLILKPRAANVGTNFVIYTNLRAYRFDYAVVDRQPDKSRDDVIYAVRFLYPAIRVVDGLTTAERIDSDLSQARDTRPRNRDYWFCGNAAVKPLAASDDGVHTRLSFGSKAELPAIFVHAEDDTETLLNFTVDGGDVVIHRVAREFVLRRGRLVGCVVNKGFSGSGERLESGTVAPSVQRARKGVRQ